MAEYLVQETSIKAIADAIREKTGTTGAMALAQMPDAIAGIQGGGTEMLDAFIDGSATELYSEVATVYGYACYNRRNLASVVLPKTTTINASAFEGCTALKSVDAPSATTISTKAFRLCSALENVKLPKARYLNTETFGVCSMLRVADMPAAQSLSTAFYNCPALTALVLRVTSSPASIGANGLYNTPIAAGNGYIYVPRALVDSYKAATNWNTYASQFRILEDYTVDGTTTGALDETKLNA